MLLLCVFVLRCSSTIAAQPSTLSPPNGSTIPLYFASIRGAGFVGHTAGGGNIATSTNILVIRSNYDLEELECHVHDRIRAFRDMTAFGLAKFGALVIIMEAGIYKGIGVIPNTGSVWNPTVGMLSIEEQGDITIIGRGEAILHCGFNVIRSWNIVLQSVRVCKHAR